MARFALLSLIPFLLVLCAAASPAAPQLPIDSDFSPSFNGKWKYTDCGRLWFAPVRLVLKSFKGLPSNAIQLESLEVSPDPPQAGHDLTVKVKATVQDVIEVNWNICYERWMSFNRGLGRGIC